MIASVTNIGRIPILQKITVAHSENQRIPTRHCGRDAS